MFLIKLYKADLLNHFQSCKNLELEKIWTCLHKVLEEHICPEKLNYDEANSTLLFKDENDRQYLLTCISFVLIYMQHLESVEKKRKHTQMEESFQALFYKLTEIQFMLSDKEVRVQFGKCLLHMCELNLKESEFSGRVRINLLLFFLWKGCSIEGKTADISKLKKYKDFCKYIKWGVSERTTDSFYVLCSYALNLPKFYENPDGKSFLSYVWSQSESIAFHLFNTSRYTVVPDLPGHGHITRPQNCLIVFEPLDVMGKNRSTDRNGNSRNIMDLRLESELDSEGNIVPMKKNGGYNIKYRIISYIHITLEKTRNGNTKIN
ncbi:hypothetical protein POVWA2_046170 [Plasmodium ovale wallikeri]|uniref:Uncharacterized protein n=1 Tax=Plasmodium ovale wallikeri TaxID=864142 RepID=A0A1A8ZI94_PLAOA|nr:hypothetical protein POVWA2_046170 [Plasmodium ovale wallikeri]